MGYSPIKAPLRVWVAGLSQRYKIPLTGNEYFNKIFP
jgi:hypothetical protein